MGSNMSTTAPPVAPGLEPAPGPRTRRVRHQARETAALMVFSAATSVGIASVLLLVVSLGR
jgi:hypothetical protein